MERGWGGGGVNWACSPPQVYQSYRSKNTVAFSYLLPSLQGSENQEQEANNNISEMEDGLASSPGASSDSPKEVGNLNRPVLEGEEGIPRLKNSENSIVEHWEREGRSGGGGGGIEFVCE